MTNVPSKKTPFRTKDLNQAAFIWAQPGVELARLQGNQGGGTTIFFLFELPMSEEELQELQLRYANGKTLVEPNLFVSKQNALRDLLHSSLGMQGKRKGVMNDGSSINGH